MKYCFWAIQTALIIAKIFEIEPITERSWWMVFSPVLVIILLFAVTATVAVLIELIKSEIGKKNEK